MAAETRTGRLRTLVDRHHRDRHGDYTDTFEAFEADWFGDEAKPIPRYAAIAYDETYSMITLCETLREALDHQAGVSGSGEYLNVPGEIVDLDTGGPVDYKMTAMPIEPEYLAELRTEDPAQVAMLAKAHELARRLNAGETASDVLEDLGFTEDDYFGEDLGSSGFGDVDDPTNDVVDLSWVGDTHYQVRRVNTRHGRPTLPFEVEVMTRPTDD